MRNRMRYFSVVGLLVVLATVGCNWESDVVSILGVVSTVASTLGAVVEVADPPIAPVVASAVAVEQGASGALSKLITDMSNAKSTTTVGTIDAAMGVLQQDTSSLVAAAQVKNPQKQAQIDAVATALEGSVAEIANAIPQVPPSTTVAELYNEGYSLEVTDSPAPIPAPSGKGKVGTRTVHSARYWRARIRKTLKAQSAYPEIDAVKKSEAKRF